MDVASLINSILADSGYDALSDDAKSKFEQYLHTPPTIVNDTTNDTASTLRELVNNLEIDFDKLSSKKNKSIREATFFKLQKEIEIFNDQFKNALKHKHELMLHNEVLSKSLHEAEVRERVTKKDDGILHLKIETLTESLLKCINEISDLHFKYYKEINELKPNLDKKEAEVLMLKNNVHLLTIQIKNQEDTIKIMNNEINDLNLIHANDTEKIKTELTKNTNFMDHYKECYEKEIEKTKNLTIDIAEKEDYISKLEANLSDVENKYLKLLNEYDQHKISNEETFSVLLSKLNASEEIVKQIFPSNNEDNLNSVIKRDTTITDVYNIYKETCLQLQATTKELDRSKKDFELLDQSIREAAPGVDIMEKNLSESLEKINTMSDTLSAYKCMLIDANNKLELSNKKCDELSKDNKRLHGIEDDLSQQICFLLRNMQLHNKNHTCGKCASPQSITSNNYVQFENIQGLQRQNKKLLEIIRSLSKQNDELSQEVQLIKDLKEKIKVLEENLESQTQELTQKNDQIKMLEENLKSQMQQVIEQKELISKIQSIDLESEFCKPLNYVQQRNTQSPTTTEIEKDIKCIFKMSENIESLKYQLSIANITITQLQGKLESNNVTCMQLEQHVQVLNIQINDLLGKITNSNIKNSENSEKLTTLQTTISTLNHENHDMKIEMDKMKNEYNNLKKENDRMYITNRNYSSGLREKTELQKEIQNVVNNLEHEVYNLKSKLAESDKLINQLKSEVDVTKDRYKFSEENLRKKIENSSQLKNEMHELSESQKNKINEIQNQLLEYEKNKSKVLEELQIAKNNNDKLLTKNTDQKNKITALEERLKKSLYDKNKLEKGLYKKLASYNNKLEMLEALEISNKTYTAEIEHLKNQNAAMEKSMKEINDMHKTKVMKLDCEINDLKEIIKSGQIENKLLSEQYKSLTNEISNLESLNQNYFLEINNLKEEKNTKVSDFSELTKMHELSESQKNKINEIQNQLLEYEKNNRKVIKELQIAKHNNDKLLTKNTEQKNKITALEEKLKKSLNDKNKLEKGLNKKLASYNNKLEILEALEISNKTYTAEIEHLKNQNAAMEKSMKEISDMHKTKVMKLDCEINDLKEIIKSGQIENKLLSEQYKSLTNEISNLESLNHSYMLEINNLKEEKNTKVSDFSELTKVKSELQYKTKIIDDMQIEVNEQKQSYEKNKSNLIEKVELCNMMEKKNKKLEEENAILSIKIKELQEIDSKRDIEITTLKYDMSRMHHLIDQKTAEIVSAQNNIEKLKKTLSGTHSDAEYKKLSNKVESEKREMTSSIDQLKSDKLHLENLIKELKAKNVEQKNTIKQEMTKIKNRITSCTKSLDTFKNIIKNYRQKFLEVVSEIHNVKAISGNYKNENEKLANTLRTERISWQAKLDELQQEVNINYDERQNLIEQGKQEGITENESLINELESKVIEFEASLRASKAEVEIIKFKSDEKELNAKKLLQCVKNKIQQLSSENEFLKTQLNLTEICDEVQECKFQMTSQQEDNYQLIAEEEPITSEEDFVLKSEQQKPSTSTGSDKSAIGLPLLNIKPLETLMEPQTTHNFMEINPYSAEETPFSSIRPMIMQPINVLPTEPIISISSNRYSVLNENHQTMEDSKWDNFTAPGCSKESEPSSLDTTHVYNTQQKRQADPLVTSYMKRFKSSIPRIKELKEIKYESPPQIDSEVGSYYFGQESNPQDNYTEVFMEEIENNGDPDSEIICLSSSDDEECL